jgi:putative ATP-dependent endonuclease of OLD family
MAAEDNVFDQEKLRLVHLTILAIEEPENSLSPFFLTRIMKQTRDIGGMGALRWSRRVIARASFARTNAEEVRYCRPSVDTLA